MEGISFSYDAEAPVLDKVSTVVPDGKLTAILGNNGAGKSTLLYCLNRILKPKAGIVRFDDIDISALKRNELARKVALVAQKSDTSNLTVFDFVLLGRRPYMNFMPSKRDLLIVQDVISQLELDSLALRSVDYLSGGEFQKVVLARALAQQTANLLLDEPTNNLDPRNQVEVMQAIRHVMDARGITAVAVMHDLNLSLSYCDNLVFLKDHRIVAAGSGAMVTSELVEQIYDIKVDIIEHKGKRVVIM
ncbi:MAG: ABC transporter ATP-binding protein [Eggerthellaceae bacterium]|nr:ABC transporter ATP-binding protein [Eggerthellaceae bacterium]